MFDAVKKIFIAGIGGVGVSALARLLQAQGYEVAGSDLSSSQLISDLGKVGIKIFTHQYEDNLPDDTDLLIYSAAVPADTPERSKAKRLNIRQASYPEALGAWVKDKKVIAIAGTNGKTTTTAMVAWIMQEAGFAPTAVVGSKVTAWKTNALSGKSAYVVLEADEYRRAFLNYHPVIGIITNIEPDHLDYYRDFDDIKEAFREFVSGFSLNGFLIYNAGDQGLVSLVSKMPIEKFSFGLDQSSGVNPVQFPGLRLLLPGKFNLANSMAAAAVALKLGIRTQRIIEALNTFTGTWRRFEVLGKVDDAVIISDYAHHPDGIRVTLETLRESYPRQKLLAVFQPHQHNRTEKLFDKFVKSFVESKIQDFVLPEIFEVAGRENISDQGVSSRDLVEALKKAGKNATYVKDLEECERFMKKNLKKFDVVIFMGAGDIYRVAEKLVNKFHDG